MTHLKATAQLSLLLYQCPKHPLFNTLFLELWMNLDLVHIFLLLSSVSLSITSIIYVKVTQAGHDFQAVQQQTVTVSRDPQDGDVAALLKPHQAAFFCAGCCHEATRRAPNVT